MAEGLPNTCESKRIAVVTGANRGIGLEICKQLASKGIVVVLTARDENRGKEALENLRGFGLSDFVVFHQLDVVDPTSVVSLADFVKTQFGKLDILVNNAGVMGSYMDGVALTSAQRIFTGSWLTPEELEEKKMMFAELMIKNHELAVQCMQTNYYGARRMAEAFIPLLLLSDSPRIVNISASMGKLKNLGKWAKGILSDVENLSEERVDEVVNEFLKDYKEDSSLQGKGWPGVYPGFCMSKIAMSAYTRILAKNYPKFCVNCCDPGYVKTDWNRNMGDLSVEEGAALPVKLAVLPDGDPSGLFFDQNGVTSFD